MFLEAIDWQVDDGPRMKLQKDVEPRGEWKLRFAQSFKANGAAAVVGWYGCVIKLLLWFDERQVGCRAEFEGERAAVAFAQTDGG